MNANINADNIAFVQLLFIAGNTMTDNIVDRDANCCWKWRNGWLPAPCGGCTVANVARNCTFTTNKVLGDLVQFGGCYPWHNIGTHHLVGLGDNTSRLPQLRHLLARFYTNHVCLYLLYVLENDD